MEKLTKQMEETALFYSDTDQRSEGVPATGKISEESWTRPRTMSSHENAERHNVDNSPASTPYYDRRASAHTYQGLFEIIHAWQFPTRLFSARSDLGLVPLLVHLRKAWMADIDCSDQAESARDDKKPEEPHSNAKPRLTVRGKKVQRKGRKGKRTWWNGRSYVEWKGDLEFGDIQEDVGWSYQRSRGPGSRQLVYHMAYGGQQSAGARQFHVSAARSVRSDEVGNYDVHRECGHALRSA